MFDGFGNNFYSNKKASNKFLMHIESKISQFEIVVKSLACFKTQFKVKESFKLLLAITVKSTW